MEEEENRRSPVREDPARGGEKSASEPPLDSDWDQSSALCAGQVIILKALQQAVGSGLAGDLQDPAIEKGTSKSRGTPRINGTDAECKRASRRKWCRSSRSEGLGGNWLGTGDPTLACDRNGPMGEVLEAPSSGVMPALAGVLDYLEWTYHLPHGVESSIGTQAVYSGEEDMEEVELVAEVRLGDVGALSGIFRRNLSRRMQKSACLGSSAPSWSRSRPCCIGHPALSEQPYSLDPHRTLPVMDKAPWTSVLGRRVSQPTKADRTSPSPCLGMTLGTGMGVSTGGQQRPQGAPGRESESQQRSQPPPASSLDKADSSTSSSSSCSSSTSSMSRHQGLPGEGGGGSSSNPCAPMRSPDLDIYDPFHPTDEDNLNGDFGFGDSPHKEAEGGRHDQKYDPFDPTGSNPSSLVSTPSPEEDDDDEDDEDDDHDQHPPDMSHSISRISETLAGIYDENSLSQDFPSSDKGQEDSEPEAEPGRDYEIEAACPSEPPESKEPPGADSTLPEELPPEQAESKTPEPRRRVFVVDLAPKGRLDAEAKPQLEGKVSLEVVTIGNAKLRSGEKTSKGGGHHRAGRRSSMEWDGSGGGDSEIEEGEIVQPEDERYSPIRLFRSRCRPAEQRTLRVVEGDDFLSLHADSDDEGALQIDFSESQPDPRWKGVDLRRKILTQRRERFHRAPSPLPPPPPPPAPKRPASKSHSGSSSGSCKKSKRERKRSRERKASKTKESYSAAWNPKKKSKSRSKSKERRHSHHRASRSRSHHRASRSWSPSISTSLSAVGSSHTSAERRKSRRSKSKEKRRGHRSRSRSSSRAHRSRHKDKHRGDGGRKKKKQQRSRSLSREKHPSHRLSKDKEREVHLLEEPKSEKVLMERRRDARTVVPPSIQDLNDNDLFTIKRTITVNQQEKMEGLLETPERAKREVLYDSEGMSFDACFSDREPPEESKLGGVRLTAKEDLIPSRKDKRPEEDVKQKVPKEKERKRAYLDDRPGARDKYKKKLKEGPPCSEPQELPKVEKKARPDRDKAGKKLKAGSHKESGKLGSGRKVKLQSKVAVLIREGVSSTTSVKEVGSIGVKFSRDKESRSPFLKSEEKVLMVGASAASQGEMADVKEPGFKPKKVKGLKAKMGVKKLKGLKPKGASEPKKKKKLKVKTGLKKSKADSCSQGASSPLRVKEEPSWSGSEKSEGTAKPPSPQPLPPDQELTPDSQTVDSSCKTPDVSFLPEDPPVEPPRVPADEPEVDSLSETKEEQPLQQPPHPPRNVPQPPAPMSWNLQGGVDCTSGVLALTALLFKMEEANLASRAKAQELIQATNQILTQTKPTASLGAPQPPAPPTHPPASHLSVPPVSYLLQGSLPLSGCGSTPTTPTGVLPGTLSQASAGPPSAGIFASSSCTDLGSTSSEGRGDSDKYLKKLHTQERAVEEVKLAIKPYYQKKEITKEEYKDILRKAVHKICHSKSGEINPVKVNNLVKAYVQRYKYFRKHGRKMDEEPGPPKEIGGLDKSGLPMPPL